MRFFFNFFLGGGCNLPWLCLCIWDFFIFFLLLSFASLQARIVALNASYFLKAGGHFVISIKVCLSWFLHYCDMSGCLNTSLSSHFVDKSSFNFPGQLHRFYCSCWGSISTGSEEASGWTIQAFWTSDSGALWTWPCLRGWRLPYAKETKTGCCLKP